MEYSSITQGIFFRKSKKLSSKDPTLALKYYEGFAPPVATTGIRSELYQRQATMLKELVQELKESWNVDLVKSVDSYVEDSMKSFKDFQGAITPIAFVVSGMPGDENKQLFETFLDTLKKQSPHIACISSRMSLNVKTAFQYLCKHIMQNDVDSQPLECISTDDEDLVPETPTNSQIQGGERDKKPKHISANDLKSWHGKTQRPPLIVCIEDIDLFPVKIIQNVIMAFSCIKLPIIFIAGITSCCETFDSFVPQKCPTTFVYKTFEALTPDKRLKRFMNQILSVQETPFQLSGDVIRYMSSIFSNEEFSITRLENIYRLCLLEHYRLAESVLCADLQYLRDNVFKPDVLTTDALKATFSSDVKQAPRMKLSGKLDGQWVVANFHSSPKKTVRQAGLQLKEVEEVVVDFRQRQLEWHLYLRFLFELISKLPGVPKDFKSFHSLYTLCSTGRIFEIVPDDDAKESYLDKALGILKLSAKSILQHQITRGLMFMEHEMEKINDSSTYETNIPNLIDRMEEKIKKLKEVDEEERKMQENEPKIMLRKPKTQTAFLQEMKERAQQSNQVYYKLRDVIIKELYRDSKTFLKPLKDLPYSKSFIFDDVEFLREMITPNTHKRIHAALVEPENFLKCDRCRNEGDDYHSSSDLSMVYSLILEQQMKNVNLNIIFESFRSQVEISPFSDVSAPKKRKAAAKKEEELQGYLIRFRQAVAELQHMGFIKNTKSRAHPDEVARLHFGF